MTKRDALWLDADPATNLPAYTALELRGALNCFQPGVIGATDFKVTTGSGLTVDSAAGRAAIRATAGGVVFGGLYYVVDDAAENSATFERTGGGTGIPANASTNPRLDAVVLHQYDHSLDSSGRRAWVREYVPGTPAGGAALGGTLPALPTSSLLIAEVLVPANNPTSIPSANIRDRRPWARGASRRWIVGGGPDYTTTSTSFVDIDAANAAFRFESGSSTVVHLGLRAAAWVDIPARIFFQPLIDGAAPEGIASMNWAKYFGVASTREDVTIDFPVLLSAGSHLLSWQWRVGGGTGTLFRNYGAGQPPLILRVAEDVRPNADNN